MPRYAIFIYSPVFPPGLVVTTIRGDVVSNGPFHPGAPVTDVFVVRAPDLDVALAIAKAHPAVRDGGAEVRPLFEPR